MANQPPIFCYLVDGLNNIIGTSDGSVQSYGDATIQNKWCGWQPTYKSPSHPNPSSEHESCPSPSSITSTPSPPPLPPCPPPPPPPPYQPVLPRPLPIPPALPNAPPTYATLPNAPLQYIQPAAPYIPQQIPQPYVYIPTHNTSEPSFPTTTHIPELKSRADWGAWNLGVLNVLTSRQLNTHICDPPSPLVPHDPFNTPSYPPVLNKYSPPQHYQEWVNWHKKDAVMYRVLTARLLRSIIGMLPLQNNPVTGTRCTAREAYQSLRRRYGGGNIQYALLEHKKLAMTNCTLIAGILTFVQNWLALAQTLKETAGYPLSYATLSVDFVNMLLGQYSEHRNKIA
ncbi:hypothetical protein ARMSODRAFT_1016785 [Armillaria solidipes]|uniref:Uncharacterized protein n=1 Tax=Armillaria solidipes TaxID=1076256 RepID=A0A2H3BQ69_9AGAR|nr:hypothetical protein ARMSODRAFT_1016785 [Armillaria solidipes]